MTGDHSLLLLETFCANACPELSNTLTAQIDRSNLNYLLEADRMLSLLVDLRGDDRKREQPARAQSYSEQPDKKQNDGHYQQSQPRGASQHRQNSRSSNGQAHAASAKPAVKLVCYVCDEEGHRGPACPELKKVKAAVKRQGQAHSATTTTVETAQTISNNAEEGHLRLAASNSPNGRSPPAPEWILDSGATHHLCTDRSLLFGVEPAKLTIKVANSETIVSSLKGSCLLQTMVGSTKRSILLTNVYYCEQVGRNLLSLSQLGSRGPRFMFAESCKFLSPDGTVVGEAIERGGLWVVNATTMGAPGSDAQALFVNVKKNSLQQWHERLGHVNFQDLLWMVNNNLANGVKLANNKITFCMACAEGKQSRNAQPTQDASNSAPTDEIGAVICMDLKVDLKLDRNGNHYVLTIVDHASNYNQVFLLHTKDETFDNCFTLCK
ncbi:hypothetical protein PF008_g405 [Phytophthora fragariae]|uniref:CCHC-type domain-containing protein n=1 Tax=Phytophthora fragariae TaxID=53985 RepID=A0A6G0SQ32_9STRA|nr:hypothetical protein PF008_g405 [Phytophthora fragariae]